jgi:hypothetical protein
MSKANSSKNVWIFKSMLVSSKDGFGLDWKFIRTLTWASTYESRTRLTYKLYTKKEYSLEGVKSTCLYKQHVDEQHTLKDVDRNQNMVNNNLPII